MSAGSPTPPSRDSFCVARPERGDQGSAWSGTGTGADTDTDPDSDVDMDMFCCHRVQDSLLSSDSRFTDYRGILNWIIILLVLTHAHLFLENFIQHGFLIDIWKVLEYVTKDSYNWSSVYLILASNMFPIIALLLERCQDKGRVSPGMGHCLHLLNLVLLMLFPSAVILHHDKSISAGGALLILCTYITLGLKLYSYQDAKRWYRQERGKKAKVVRLSLRGACKDLYYFLLAPTLCYQWDFPRTSSIRINFLLQRVLEMVMLTQLMVGIVQQWIGPIFQRSASPFSNMDVTTRIEHMVELVAPSHFLWLILFFLFSHSWLNFSGELLCFGDRHFYGDWWNAETLRSFWRKWSVPFHKWTYRHLYRPLMKKKVAPQQAEVLIFLLSAAVFEYVFAMSLRTCRFWIFSIMILELLVAVFLGHYFTGNYGNGLVWLCLLLGPPLAVMCYFHDYYMSHHGQPPWTLY
ncbi:diacylglycerol O-acyltransferase 1-like isoform X2 [Scleropages formosus]|nr:diacylglycerol O-acyltransferase 1-like isoform X2 [Scleropages formosus]